jgi:hypothetical protein
LLLLISLGLTTYFFLMGRVDDKLTQEILKHFRKEFPSHQVFIDRAQLQSGKSITIEGVRIAKPTDQGLRDVMRCGRVTLSGPIDLIGLVQGQFPIQRVAMDGLELCAWPMSDGRICLQEFLGRKSLNANMPSIEVRSGLLRLGGEIARADQEIICHDLRVQAALSPPMIDGKIMPLSAKITASVASSFFSNASANIMLTDDKGTWNAQGQIVKFEYSPRFVDQLPACLRQYLVIFSGFSGQIHSVFTANSHRGKITFEASSSINHGRLLHPKVPYPMESISGELVCKNGLLQFKDFTASSGETQVAFACNVHGYSLASPMDAAIAVQGLSLDKRLYDALPPAIQETWRKMGVNGKIDAQAKLQFDGQNWNPVIAVQAKNAGLEPDFFPYPIRNLNGEFIYQNGFVVAKQLVAQAGEQTIRGALTLTKAQPRWLMDLSIKADGPISIDEGLLKSLSPRESVPSGLQNFVMSLHPTGTVHLKHGRFVRSADRPEFVSRSLEMTFSECAIKYDAFRYPIADVQGDVTVDNERILLRDFIGRNDGARIKCHGFCQTRSSSVESLELYLDAYDVGLDEELQMALPRNVRSLWDQLQPAGVLDEVAIEIVRKSSSPAIDLRVEVVERRESESLAGRSVSIRPLSLPYQVNDIACNIVYRPGRIDIKSLSGSHEISRMQTEGMCRLHSDGTWDGLLTWLPATRLLVDQTLLHCLPSYLRDPLVRMDFRGPVSITGMTQVSSAASANTLGSANNVNTASVTNTSIVREWDLLLQIEDGRMGGGGIASGIRGSLSLKGENTPQGPMAFGNLELDALAIKNIAVTGVRGPFAFNQQELLFGRDAVAWQQKYNIQLPSLSSTEDERQVSNGVLFATPDSFTKVVPASFRSSVRELAGNRPGLLNRAAQQEGVDPNEITSSADVPSLDIKDGDIRARALSGTIFVSGTEPFDSQQRGRYRLRLVDADLHGCLVDLGETNANSSGRLSVQCDLNGALTNATSLEGQGRVWLRNANLYELPTMIRLFQVLAINPKQGAFDSADIRFSIDGDQLPIQELALEGDLVSMRGSGWVNMRRDLHLELSGNVGRKGGIFRPITRASGAKLWQLEVNGTTNDPQIRRPLINTFDKSQ